jgi:hypothetical protein
VKGIYSVRKIIKGLDKRTGIEKNAQEKVRYTSSDLTESPNLIRFYLRSSSIWSKMSAEEPWLPINADFLPGPVK